MHIEGEKHYYEAKTNRDHCHMACFRCGAIMEYASSSFEKLKQEMAKQSGFQIRVVRLEVGGVCKRCQKAEVLAASIFFALVVATGSQLGR